MLLRKPTRGKQRAQECLEPLARRIREAGLPVLHRACADPDARRQDALDQSGPRAMSPEQAAEGRGFTRGLHPSASWSGQCSSVA